MARPERTVALEHRLKELDGMSDGLRVALDHRVGTASVHGSGSTEAPQVIERLVEIEKTQRQLGDAVAALRIEMTEMAAKMKVVYMALGKRAVEGDSSRSEGKFKIPEPKPDASGKNAQRSDVPVGKREHDIKASYIGDPALVARQSRRGPKCSSHELTEKGSKALKCFLCEGPHKAVECPLKAALNASKVETLGGERMSTEGHSKGSNARRPLMCFLCEGPHRVKECPQKAALDALKGPVIEGEHDGNKGHEKGSNASTPKCFVCERPHELKECPQMAELAALRAQVPTEQQASNKRFGEGSGASQSHGTRD